MYLGFCRLKSQIVAMANHHRCPKFALRAAYRGCNHEERRILANVQIWPTAPQPCCTNQIPKLECSCIGVIWACSVGIFTAFPRFAYKSFTLLLIVIVLAPSAHVTWSSSQHHTHKHAMTPMSKIPPKEWESYKEMIVDLYLEQGKKLADVIKILAKDHSFHAR